MQKFGDLLEDEKLAGGDEGYGKILGPIILYMMNIIRKQVKTSAHTDETTFEMTSLCQPKNHLVPQYSIIITGRTALKDGEASLTKLTPG